MGLKNNNYGLNGYQNIHIPLVTPGPHSSWFSSFTQSQDEDQLPGAGKYLHSSEITLSHNSTQFKLLEGSCSSSSKTA